MWEHESVWTELAKMERYMAGLWNRIFGIKDASTHWHRKNKIFNTFHLGITPPQLPLWDLASLLEHRNLDLTTNLTVSTELSPQLYPLGKLQALFIVLLLWSSCFKGMYVLTKEDNTGNCWGTSAPGTTTKPQWMNRMLKTIECANTHIVPSAMRELMQKPGVILWGMRLSIVSIL